MNYAKRYCELKAGLSANIALMKTLRGQLRVYEQSEDPDLIKMKACREELKVVTLIVSDGRVQLSRLEAELKRLSSGLDDVELKVFTLHYINGLKLTKIAKKLYFSYDRIKQIHKSIRTKIEANL